jgi:hypothetical protein
MWPNERKKERKGGKEKKLKSTYLVRLNIKLIKRHKCGPRRFPEERQAEWRVKKRSTHVRRRFSVAGIAFAAFVVVFLRVLVRARVGGLAESYLARKKRELLVGCGHFAVCSQMPTAFTLLSDDYGFTKLRGGVCLSTRR